MISNETFLNTKCFDFKQFHKIIFFSAFFNAFDVSILSTIYYTLQRLPLFNTINTQNDSHIMVTVVIVIYRGGHGSYTNYIL